MTPVLPPLDLAVEVTDAAGVRSRWDPNDESAGNRPMALSFSTKRGDGFAGGSVTLARRIDRNYVDLSLFDDVAFVGVDGSTAYEGRIAAQPRSFDESHSISVQCAGWMAHARDQKFTTIFVDRDLSAFTGPSRSRQVTLLAANFMLHGFEVSRDTTNNAPALVLGIDGNWLAPQLPLAEAVYDAGSENKIAKVYIWARGAAGVAGNAAFNLNVQGGPGDAAPDVASADLWAGADSAQYVTISPRRFISLSFQYTVTPAGTAGFSFRLALATLAMYGDHGLTLYGDAPGGVTASDVIRYIVGKWCPMLETTGVLDTQWPIPHLAFREPTDPYDAFLAVNAFHLWELAVWENKTLYFEPADRTDYDWEVRLSDFGVTVELQGDSTDDLVNGIVVDFTNVQTWAPDTITPNQRSELADTNPDNPVNKHGLTRWTRISLTNPATTEAAVQIARSALVEFSQPKAPGTIRITGHIRDRAGHWQQGWKVRAGDMIAITDHPNDSPRMITETKWDHDSKQLTVTVDSTSTRLDAVLDRVGTALQAAGI